MGIKATGAATIGPRGSGSSLATLADYLASISKNTFYSLFEAGTGMFQNSNGTGAVVSGDPVGCWAASVQVGATFKFIQATSASRPTYSTTQYRLPTIYGNGSSHTLLTDSTTALNRACTILVQYCTGVTNAGMTWSQNGSVWALRHVASTQRPVLTENGGEVNGQAVTAGPVDQVCASVLRYRASAAAYAGDYFVGLSSTDEIRTSRYNTALYLLSSNGTGSFSPKGIRRIAITERLTFDEMTQAGRYMVS